MKKFKILLVILCLLTLVVGCGKKEEEKKPDKPKEDVVDISLEDQVVDGLKISGFNITYKNGMSKVVASVTNTTDSSINVLNVGMVLYDKSKQEVVRTLGYVGESIAPAESRIVETDVTMNLKNVKSVVYTVNRAK